MDAIYIIAQFILSHNIVNSTVPATPPWRVVDTDIYYSQYCIMVEGPLYHPRYLMLGLLTIQAAPRETFLTEFQDDPILSRIVPILIDQN